MARYDSHPLLYFTADIQALDIATIEARLEPNARTRDGREPDIVLARMPIGMQSGPIHRALDFALASAPKYWVELPDGLEERTVRESDNAFIYRLRGSADGIVPLRWGHIEQASTNRSFDPIAYLKENGYL